MKTTINETQTQPSMDEINRAFHWAALMANHAPILKRDSVKSLRALRDAKTTWVGAEECALRCMVDKYLRENEL